MLGLCVVKGAAGLRDDMAMVLCPCSRFRRANRIHKGTVLLATQMHLLLDVVPISLQLMVSQVCNLVKS